MGKLKRLSWLKSRRVMIPLLVIAMIIAAAVLAIHNLNSPAQGSINQIPLDTAEKINPYIQPGSYKGKYISFSYPAHYKAVPSRLSGSYLEVADYHSTDVSSKQISIGVYRGSITSDSGFIYRERHKEIYKESDSRLGSEFLKLDGTEDTFFMEHNGLLTTVSATAPYGGLSGEALFVASSLKWI